MTEEDSIQVVVREVQGAVKLGLEAACDMAMAMAARGVTDHMTGPQALRFFAKALDRAI